MVTTVKVQSGDATKHQASLNTVLRHPGQVQQVLLIQCLYWRVACSASIRHVTLMTKIAS